MGKISIPEENGVNLPTRKRIISSFSTPETMRFLVLKNFRPPHTTNKSYQ